MSWRAYSWRAITCCVSKGTLTVVAMACVLVGVIAGGHQVAERQEAKFQAKADRCRDLLDSAQAAMETVETDWGDGWTRIDVEETEQSRALMAQYEKECGAGDPWRPPEWLGTVLGCLIAFIVGSGLIAAICSEQITYCQVAVDTGRRPWYWLPWVGDPLEPRELVTCEHCGHSSVLATATRVTRTCHAGDSATGCIDAKWQGGNWGVPKCPNPDHWK